MNNCKPDCDNKCVGKEHRKGECIESIHFYTTEKSVVRVCNDFEAIPMRNSDDIEKSLRILQSHSEHKKSDSFNCQPPPIVAARILIMDDEVFLLEVLGSIIKTFGYTIETVRNGSDALETYKKALEAQEKFHIVIFDLTIPGGMGGKQTMREILKIDPSVKAIATTGYSDDPVVADPQQFGFKAALQKPYTIDELSILLEKVLLAP